MIKRLIVFALILLTFSCGKKVTDVDSSSGGSSTTEGGSSGGAEVGEIETRQTIEGTGLDGAIEVSGEVVTESGLKIGGATVYIPGASATTSSGSTTRSFSQGLVASDGTVCENAPDTDQALVATCTAADGTFTLDTSQLTGNPTQVVIQKGTLRIIVPLSCTNNVCVIDTSYTTVGSSASVTSWPKVAVVTGDLDRMEDVLAKMADPDTSDNSNGDYGRVDAGTGGFVYGSEYSRNLTIIDGTGSTTSEENGISYKTWVNYLLGTYPLVSNGAPVFDIIFVNCGDAYESYIATGKTVLQNYVNAGGRLFVTDLSYDFIEQPFPYVMKFEGDSDTATTPGTLNAAQTGAGGNTIDAMVNSTSMEVWLSGVNVNAHGGTTAGNPENDCSYPEVQDQATGALLSNALLPLGGFLNHWVHMVSAHTGYEPLIWISSGNTALDGLTDRPLTISMDIGSNGGKVVYSSYHTANDCPSTTFWPQERALEFLILESF